MKVLLLPLFTTILIVCSCQTEPTYGPRPQKKYAEKVPTLTQMTYNYTDTVRGYRMKMLMPALQNNTAFSAIVTQSLQENKAHFENFIADFGHQNNVLTSSFEMVQLTDSIVSIRQDYVWAVPGTSVLQYSFGPINFQPATNKKIQLKDLFRKGVDYRPLVVNTLKEKIQIAYDLQEIDINEQDIKFFVIGADFIEFSKVLYPHLMESRPQRIRIPFSDWEKELAW